MQYIGHVRGNALIYLSPQEIPDSSTNEQLCRYFASVLGTVPAPWILVINCAGANLMQLSSAKRVNTILRTEYSDKICETWLMNTSSIVRGAMNLFLTKSDEAATLICLETDRLGLFVQLQRIGCSHTLVDWFIQKLR